MRKASIKFGVSLRRLAFTNWRSDISASKVNCLTQQKKPGWREIPAGRLVSLSRRNAGGSITRVGLARCRIGPRFGREGADARRPDAAIAFVALRRRHHAAVGVGDEMPRGVSGGQHRSGEGGCSE